MSAIPDDIRAGNRYAQAQGIVRGQRSHQPYNEWIESGAMVHSVMTSTEALKKTLTPRVPQESTKVSKTNAR